MIFLILFCFFINVLSQEKQVEFYNHLKDKNIEKATTLWQKNRSLIDITRDYKDGKISILQSMILLGNVDAVKFLLEKGADPNFQTTLHEIKYKSKIRSHTMKLLWQAPLHTWVDSFKKPDRSTIDIFNSLINHGASLESIYHTYLLSLNGHNLDVFDFSPAQQANASLKPDAVELIQQALFNQTTQIKRNVLTSFCHSLKDKEYCNSTYVEKIENLLHTTKTDIIELPYEYLYKIIFYIHSNIQNNKLNVIEIRSACPYTLEENKKIIKNFNVFEKQLATATQTLREYKIDTTIVPSEIYEAYLKLGFPSDITTIWL